MVSKKTRSFKKKCGGVLNKTWGRQTNAKLPNKRLFFLKFHRRILFEATLLFERLRQFFSYQLSRRVVYPEPAAKPKYTSGNT